MISRIFTFLFLNVLVFSWADSLWGSTPAEPLGTLVAGELAVKADALYETGKYGEAAQLYRQFAQDFGQAPEAQDIIRRMRYPLAFCLIQAKDYPGALTAIEDALAANPPLEMAQIEELTFWQGVCLLQASQTAEARAALEKFCRLIADLRRPSAARTKRPEAELLIGATYLLENDFTAASAHYAALKPRLTGPNRGRAVVWELHALLQAGDNESAVAVVGAEFPRLHELWQLAAFQLLTLDLGSRLLDEGKHRPALFCLQRIWSKDRLTQHQQARLRELEMRAGQLAANPRSDPYEKFLIAQMVVKVKGELDTLAKIAHFDSSLRLRLATAYQAMERYRESALILEAMLQQMPADPVVEAATVNLVQCWLTAERWPKATEAAQLFAEKFPRSASLPLIIYLSAVALQRGDRPSEAVPILDRLARDFASSEFAPRALFLKGFCLLQADRPAEAVTAFEHYRKSHPKHELAESAIYWRAMGLSFNRQYEACREAMDDYLRGYPDGAFVGQAHFRRAYCAQRLKNFPQSIAELNTYLRDFPQDEETSEARLLLGDALLNEGQAQEGIAAWEAIPPEDTRFFTEAAFKIGKARRLLEEPAALREGMVRFQTGLPRSPRVVEAIYWIGWTHIHEGQPDLARQAYWQAIDQHGSDPEVRSVEELFPALAKLYKGDEAAYDTALEERHRAATASGQKTAALRLLWAQARAKSKSDPAAARRLLLEIGQNLSPSLAHPLVMEDAAKACASAGRPQEAARLYEDLIKWNPNAAQKAAALAALGFWEMDNGRPENALVHFNRFQRETHGSTATGKVLLAKATLLHQQHRGPECRQSLNDLLAHASSTGPEKAEALFRLGEMHMAEKEPRLAIPYFQRVYLMHRRWREWTARAYLRSGEAFEQIRDLPAARRTYEELAGSEDLAELKECRQARQRLAALANPPPAQG